MTAQLERMIGNTYVFEGKKILVYDVRVKGNIATIVTDKEAIELPLDGLGDYLPEFEYVKSNQLVKNPEILDMVTSSGSVYSQLQQTLMESISKIKDDKGFIEQAEAINNTIKQVIDLEKIKIQAIGLLK